VCGFAYLSKGPIAEAVMPKEFRTSVVGRFTGATKLFLEGISRFPDIMCKGAELKDAGKNLEKLRTILRL